MSPQSAIRFLVGLLVLALVLWCCWLVLGMFPLPYPLATIVMVILCLIALGVLLNWTGYWPGPPVP